MQKDKLQKKILKLITKIKRIPRKNKSPLEITDKIYYPDTKCCDFLVDGKLIRITVEVFNPGEKRNVEKFSF